MSNYKVSYEVDDVATIEGKMQAGNSFKACFNIEKIVGDNSDPKEIIGEGFLETNGWKYYVTRYDRDKGFKHGKDYIQ